MKRIILSIICGFFLSANLVSALTYNESFSTDVENPPLPASKIYEAELLESYIVRYREKITSVYASFSKEHSVALENARTQLKKMERALEKIQTQPITENDANEIMQSIVSDIKVLNTRMKVYLEQEQILADQRLQEQKNKYIKVGSQISKLLDSFIEKMTAQLIKKQELSKKEKEIVRSLLRIREQNEKLRSFSQKDFNSPEDVKLYLQSIIEQIRKEIRIIKQLTS